VADGGLDRADHDEGMTRTRYAAAAGALAVTGGAVAMLVALVALPGPWWQGYVSEAGTSGQPHAVAYRWGLLCLALGVGLLGGALRPTARLVPACLLAAAVMAGTSGVVPCSAGCPLPPYETTTIASVVHTAASITGLVVLAAAMATTALTGPGSTTRRLAAGAVALTVPLGAALGLTMLLAGRGTLGAVLERLVLVVAVSWLVGTGLLTALSRPAAAP
jgi:uncharacterized protein DUF998